MRRPFVPGCTPPPGAFRALASLGALLALLVVGRIAHALPFDGPRARLAILELRLADAADILKGNDSDLPVAMERARLAIYRGDCDDAVSLLNRPDAESHDEAAYLHLIAKGCARSSAGTVRDTHADKQIDLRFQDDADRPLTALIVATALTARDQLERDLGVRLPDPIRIDIVRDQFALAAHTGLPEEAAQTTGTVAIAKWGRVIMISPRAPTRGYGWRDTLAHELTHLVVAQATLDRAPLWLQEGVAKREETRWRKPHAFDSMPSPSAVAYHGIKQGLGLELTKLGPSIAMLPTAEQARVAFAEVASFIAYYADKNGKIALPKLLEGLRDAPAKQTPEETIKKVSGKSLSAWEKEWRVWLNRDPQRWDLPVQLMPGKKIPRRREAAKNSELAILLLNRGHADAAIGYAGKAAKLVPNDASIHGLMAEAYLAVGDRAAARQQVVDPKAIVVPTAYWWHLNAFLSPEPLADAAVHAQAIHPFGVAISCDRWRLGEYPSDDGARALCRMARDYDDSVDAGTSR